jgi:hypothetical protein
LAVTPDGRHVVFGSGDHTLRVWDLKDGKEILTFTVDGHVTTCVASQDNRTIVAGDDFGRLHFLRAPHLYVERFVQLDQQMRKFSPRHF